MRGARGRARVSEPVTLGLTTAGSVAAAVLRDASEFALTSERQALGGALRCVSGVLDAAGIELEDVDQLCVCIGPGSFTGLRIGVALMKSIAQAREAPVAGVSAYDVADFALAAVLPRAAIVAGKRDYFYARIRRAADAAPEHVRGSAEALSEALQGMERANLADVRADEQALRVARIGRRMFGAGEAGDWRRITIDYGQRPNAALNWEVREGAARRGGSYGPSKSIDE